MPKEVTAKVTLKVDGRFDDYSLAFDRCRDEGRPLVVQVGDELTKIFPSGSYLPLNYETRGKR